MIKAIFFDLDGVLINSEIQDQNWNKEYLNSIQSPLPPERLYYLIGSHKTLNPWPKIIEGYEDVIELEDFKTGLRAYKSEKREKRNFAEIIYEDTLEVLQNLKNQGIKLVCASSSNMEYIKKALTQTNLLPLFDMICTGDDFNRSKPAPDIYLYCQNYFKYEKNECLVVEDSPLGIEAGKSAGLKVFARKTPFGLDQSKADYIIPDLRPLVSIVAEINKGVCDD